METPDTKLSLGFIYVNYRPRAFMWEIVVIARLVLFAFISVVYQHNVRLQAILGLAILFASVLAHEGAHPFASKELQEIEAMALIASWSTLFCGTLLFNESVSKAVRSIVTVATVLVRPQSECDTSSELLVRKRCVQRAAVCALCSVALYVAYKLLLMFVTSKLNLTRDV